MNELLQNIPQQELNTNFLYFLTSSLVVYFIGLKLTNDRKFSFIAAFSLFITAFISTLTLFLMKFGLDLSVNSLYYISFWLTYLFVIYINIQVSLYYSSQLKLKKFDIDYISRKHFSVSLNSAILLTLFCLAAIAFSPTSLQLLLSHLLISSLLSISLSHLVVRKTIKE